MPDPLTLGLGLGLGVGLPAIAACITGICYRYRWRQDEGVRERREEGITVVIEYNNTEDNSFTSPVSGEMSPSQDHNAFTKLAESSTGSDCEHLDKLSHLPTIKQQTAIKAETTKTSITFNNLSEFQQFKSTHSEQRSSEKASLELAALAKDGMSLVSSITSSTASSAIKGAKAAGEKVYKKFSKSKKGNDESDAEGSGGELQSTSSSLSYNRDRHITKHTSRVPSSDEQEPRTLPFQHTSSDESTPELHPKIMNFADDSSPKFVIIPISKSAHGSKHHSRGSSPLFGQQQNEVFISHNALKQEGLQKLASKSMHGTPEDQLRSVFRGLSPNRHNETSSSAPEAKDEDDSPSIKQPKREILKQRLALQQTQLEIEVIELQSKKMDAQAVLVEKQHKLHVSESVNMNNTPSSSPFANKTTGLEVCHSKVTGDSYSSSASSASASQELQKLTKSEPVIIEAAAAAVEAMQGSLQGSYSEQGGRFMRVLSVSESAPSPPPSPYNPILATPRSNNSSEDLSSYSPRLTSLMHDFSPIQSSEQDILSPKTKLELKTSVQDCFGASSAPKISHLLSHHHETSYGTKIMGHYEPQANNLAATLEE